MQSPVIAPDHLGWVVQLHSPQRPCMTDWPQTQSASGLHSCGEAPVWRPRVSMLWQPVYTATVHTMSARGFPQLWPQQAKDSWLPPSHLDLEGLQSV